MYGKKNYGAIISLYRSPGQTGIIFAKKFWNLNRKLVCEKYFLKYHRIKCAMPLAAMFWSVVYEKIFISSYGTGIISCGHVCFLLSTWFEQFWKKVTHAWILWNIEILSEVYEKILVNFHNMKRATLLVANALYPSMYPWYR